MLEAIIEAEKAIELAECPIGCVIVKDGKILVRAHNLRLTRGNAIAHAEVIAIDKACRKIGDFRLCDCDMYVTLEPCTMCAGAILHARLAGVVYGCEDRLAGAVASRADVLDQGLAGRLAWHMGGVLARDCQELLQAFFAARRG